MVTPRTVALTSAICLISVSLSTYADVRAHLSESMVEENEPVELTIISSGSNRTSAPDLAPLSADFDVLGTNTSSQFSNINGRVEAWVEYRYSLRPKRTGQLVVPSLDIAGESTLPLSLTVRPLDPSVRSTIRELVFFETKLDPEPVYVQAQLVLTRRFFYARGVQLYSDLPAEPEIEGAVVLALGETRSTTARRNDRTYGVVVQQYAVFPQRSGKLIVPGANVAASVLVTSNGRTRRRGVQVAAPELSLDVLPIPAAYPADAPWLPAHSIQVNERLAPNRNRLEVGVPATRTLQVLASGAIGSAIPPLVVEHPGDMLRSYPEAPTIRDETAGTDVIGIRTQTYSLMPTAPGLLRLPELAVTWWDTVNERVEVTRLAGRDLEITGMAPVVESPADEPAPEPAAVPLATMTPDDVTHSEPASWTPPAWLVASVLALFVLGAAWNAFHRRLWRLPDIPKRRPDPASVLHAACRNGSPEAIRHSLRDWLRYRYPDRSPAAALQTFTEVGGNADVVDALDASLYAPHTATAPPGRAIWEAVTRAGTSPARPARRRMGDPLPPLATARSAAGA